jgi:hypothetical protein
MKKVKSIPMNKVREGMEIRCNDNIFRKVVRLVPSGIMVDFENGKQKLEHWPYGWECSVAIEVPDRNFLSENSESECSFGELI